MKCRVVLLRPTTTGQPLPWADKIRYLVVPVKFKCSLDHTLHRSLNAVFLAKLEVSSEQAVYYLVRTSVTIFSTRTGRKRPMSSD